MCNPCVGLETEQYLTEPSARHTDSEQLKQQVVTLLRIDALTSGRRLRHKRTERALETPDASSITGKITSY